MKKSVAITGYISTLFIIMGSIFKLMHWPGAGPLIVLGISIPLTLFLVLMLIYNLKNNEEGLETIKSILLFVGLLTLFIGTMFKLMHWPGSYIILLYAKLPLTAFVVVHVVLFVRSKKYQDLFSWLYLLVGIASVAMVLTITAPKNRYYSLVKSNNKLTRNNQFLNTSNKSLYKLLANELEGEKKETFIKIRDLSKAQLNLIDEYKIKLFAEANMLSDDMKLDSLLLPYAPVIYNYDIPTQVLLYADDKPANNLKNSMVNYYRELNDMNVSVETQQLLKESLGEDGFEDIIDWYEEDPITWEQNIFYSKTIAGSIKALTNLQNSILNAESLVLNDLIYSNIIPTEGNQ